MKNKILLITNKEDITIDCVVDRLNKRNISYYRLNTEEIGKQLYIEINLNDSLYYVIDNLKRVRHNLSDFSAVYYRRPKLPTAPEGLKHNEINYFNNEIGFLLEGIYRLLSDKIWLNNVYDIRSTENKLYQLDVAKRIGFNIPKSVITNSSQYALNFINTNKCIFKPIKSGFIGEDKENTSILYTTRIDDNFKDNITSIKCLPTYFQEEIIKDTDIRVTVVDKNIFAAEIESQGNNSTIVDWRKTSEILPHKRILLPKTIEDYCLKLCNYFNLKFAAIDLIKSNSNEYWFLEINPNGQWGWIEKILSYNISDSIIDYLINEVSQNENIS